jgi:hypothetical protein
MSVLDNLFDQSPEAKMAKKLGITKKTLETMFNDFDKDGSGALDAGELQTLAASIGIMWDASQVEEAVQAIDTDGNGTIDIKEFATWFCQQPDGGDEPSEMLKMSLQAKILIRMVTKALKDVTDEGGRECKNQAAMTVGDIDIENSRGMIKMYGCGSTQEELDALNPPEGACGAVHIDFNLAAGASEGDIQSIIDGCNDAWGMFAEPLIDEIPTPPQVPGMKDGQPFAGKRIERVGDVLRFIIFTGVDPASIWSESGLNAGEFVPSLHHAQYFNYAISDIFNTAGPTSLKNWIGGRAEYNFTWNTKTLKAARAILNTDMVRNNMGRHDKPALYITSVLSKAFRCQNSSFEVAFNGYQDLMEAAILDGAMTAFEEKQIERASWGYGGDEEDCNPWEPLPARPSDEVVSGIIAAVGNLSGKTFGNLRNEILAQGAVFPMPGQRGVLVSPLFMAKQMLEQCPPDFEEYKNLALTFVATVTGVAKASAVSSFVKAGVETRGLDFYTLLPTKEQIEASSMAEVDDEPPALLAHFQENGNIFTQVAMAEMCKAAKAGMVPGIPEEFVAELEKVQVDEAAWAQKKDDYSELIDVLKAAWPIFKDFVPPGMPEEMCAFAKEIPVRLLGLE